MGNKGWSILFGVVMLACALSFAVAPMMGWWLPRGESSHAWDVDFLFYVIFWIVAFFFILTEAVLVIFLWLYASNPDGKRPVSESAEAVGFMKPVTGFLNNEHRIELAWTFIPSVILLYIAFAQVSAWADIKYAARQKDPWKSATVGKTDGGAALQMAVSARQFEWRVRYPSVERFKKWMDPKRTDKSDYDSFGKAPQADDIYVVNEIHFWEDYKITPDQNKPNDHVWRHNSVVVYLTTRDVIHSFNLPNFRVKQDALPGKMIPVWFRTAASRVEKMDGKIDERYPLHKTHNCKWDNDKNRYVDGINPDSGEKDNAFIFDLACAELCGWGHYRMIGRAFVHKDQADFLNWLEIAEKENRKRE